MSDLSPNAPRSGAIRIERANETSVFSRGYFAVLHSATFFLFFLSAILTWIFGFTFWTLFEACVRAFGWPHGKSILVPLFLKMTGQHGLLPSSDGWPIDLAIVAALFASWCSLYLALDHVMLAGNHVAQRRIKDRWQSDPERIRFTPNQFEGIFDHFVELRGFQTDFDLDTDLGYLMLTPQEFRFFGERQYVAIPRSAFASPLRFRRSFGDLGGAYIFLPLKDSEATIQLLGRHTASRLSATVHDSKRVAEILEQWLAPSPTDAEPPPKRDTDRDANELDRTH